MKKVKNNQVMELICDLKRLSIESKAKLWKTIAVELERSTRQKREVNVPHRDLGEVYLAVAARGQQREQRRLGKAQENKLLPQQQLSGYASFYPTPNISRPRPDQWVCSLPPQ